MIAQVVTDIIETEGMSDLGIEKSDDMTPHAEGAGLLIETVLASELRDKLSRNELADLSQDWDFRRGRFIFIQQADPGWDGPPAPFLFINWLWDGCEDR